MTPGRRRRAIAGALVLALLAGFVANRFVMSTEITHFLPSEGARTDAAISRALAESPLSRTVILSVEATEPQRARAAAKALAEGLRGDPRWAWVSSGPDPALGEAVYTLLFPHRFGFMSPRPEAELPERLSDAGLRTAAATLKRDLAGPQAPFVKRLAPADPLLSFREHLARLESLRGDELAIVEGQYVTSGGQAILFAESVASPFDAKAQRPLMATITDHFAELKDRLGDDLTLEQSGIARFAIDSEARIKADVAWIGGLSAVGLVLLLTLAFGSLALLALGLVPLFSGVVAGTAVTLAIFGSIHGLTLAFGAALLGVCMDYPIHLFNHRALGRSDGGVDDALRRVWPGIALGGLTTIVGFGGLALSDFPGIQEVGVFAIAGVLGALCATRWWVPSLAPETWPVTRLQRRGADALANLLELLRRRRLWIAALPLSAVVLTAVALPTLVWQDDVTALADRSEVLLAEDGRVRARVGGTEPGRVIAAVGDTWEQAVARNDAAAALLEGLVAETPELRARSVHALLWSEALQRRNLEAVAAAPDLAGRMNDALTAEGFVPEAFAPFAQDLQAETPPLTYAALEASPVGRLIRPFAVKVDGRPALLTFLRGGGELEELRRGLGPLDGVHVFDQRAFLSAAFAEHRARTLELILLGLAGVFFVVLGRYRRLGPSVAAFAPAVLAAGVAAAILALMGTALHLLHLASLLLVLSMGVDYGVFLVESARQSTGLAATMASIVVAAVSTLLGFGLLALSDNPALRAIGVTTTLGILASVVLAPTALLLVGEET